MLTGVDGVSGVLGSSSHAPPGHPIRSSRPHHFVESATRQQARAIQAHDFLEVMTITLSLWLAANYSFRSSSMYPMRSNTKAAHSGNSRWHPRAGDLCIDLFGLQISMQLSRTFKSFIERPLLSYGGSMRRSYSSDRRRRVLFCHSLTYPGQILKIGAK